MHVTTSDSSAKRLDALFDKHNIPIMQRSKASETRRTWEAVKTFLTRNNGYTEGFVPSSVDLSHLIKIDREPAEFIATVVGESARALVVGNVFDGAFKFDGEDYPLLSDGGFLVKNSTPQGMIGVGPRRGFTTLMDRLKTISGKLNVPDSIKLYDMAVDVVNRSNNCGPNKYSHNYGHMIVFEAISCYKQEVETISPWAELAGRTATSNLLHNCPEFAGYMSKSANSDKIAKNLHDYSPEAKVALAKKLEHTGQV